MIARIAGQLEHAADGAALIDVGGGLCYEVLIPACDIERLERRVNSEVVLHTIHYFEGDPSRGMQTPRLIGFCTESDRDFFRVFTTVKGVGVRKALRALVRPVAEVAAAIRDKDSAFLVALPEIGKRTAEQIVAELNDRVDDFAGGAAPTVEAELSEPAQEAVAVLIQLGERRADATVLIERVTAVAPELDTPEQILQQAYRLKAGGK